MVTASVFLMLGAGAAAPAAAQDMEHPIAAEVKKQVKDTSKPFTMMVYLKVKEGAGPKFETAFAKAIKGTRKEKGNKAYDLNRSAKDPAEYIVYERWQNLAALEAHLKTPHITTLLEEVGDLLDGMPEVRVFVPAGE
jgi:quinol monooxygenase YgiN